MYYYDGGSNGLRMTFFTCNWQIVSIKTKRLIVVFNHIKVIQVFQFTRWTITQQERSHFFMLHLKPTVYTATRVRKQSRLWSLRFRGTQLVFPWTSSHSFYPGKGEKVQSHQRDWQLQTGGEDGCTTGQGVKVLSMNSHVFGSCFSFVFFFSFKPSQQKVENRQQREKERCKKDDRTSTGKRFMVGVPTKLHISFLSSLYFPCQIKPPKNFKTNKNRWTRDFYTAEVQTLCISQRLPAATLSPPFPTYIWVLWQVEGRLI